MFQIKQRSLILTSVNLPQLFKPQMLKMLLQHTDVWLCFHRMMIFCLYLCVLLNSQHGHCSYICPKNCICEQASSVQCFRAQAVPPLVSNNLKKIHLGYNHLKELKVFFACSLLMLFCCLGFIHSQWMKYFTLLIFLFYNEMCILLFRIKTFIHSFIHS